MTTRVPPLQVSADRLADVCRAHGVATLALFGSRARAEALPDSDVDLLVTFQPDVRVGLIELGRLKHDLEALFGRPVDLVPRDGLKAVIRDEVLAQARALFAA